MPTEKRYYDGYIQAHYRMLEMNEQELLACLDALFGRDNLPEDYTLQELRTEALAQCKREFQTPYGKEQDEFNLALAKFIRSTKQ